MKSVGCCKTNAEAKVFVLLCSWAVLMIVYVICFSNFTFDTENRNTLLSSFNATGNQMVSIFRTWKRNILNSPDDKKKVYKTNVNGAVREIVKNTSGYLNTTEGYHFELRSTVSSIQEPPSFRELLKIKYNTFSSGIGNDNLENGEKYLIYRCDSKWMSHCGGWADRIKGIMTGYIIANLTGRTFKAEMKTHGCNLLDYLVPNHVNWSLPRSLHKQVHRDDDVNILNVVDSLVFYNSVRIINFKTLPSMQAKFVYFKANLDFTDGFKANKIYAKQLSWMANATRDRVAGIIFRRLFKLAPPLREKLEEILNKSLRDSSEKLVCAHIRMGKNPTIPNDSAVRNDPKVLPKVWEFIKRVSSRYNRTKIFVTSDSEDTIQDAKKDGYIRDRLLLVPGEIAHIERNKDMKDEDVCESQTKMVLEQFMLMHCDVLLISMSGLSRTAAYVRGSDVGLFCLVSGKIIPCKLAKLKEIYKIRG